MPSLLENYLAANLIDQLAGDDTRFEKISAAARTVAEALRKSPNDLIPAILAGMDPVVAADDPSMQRAYHALLAQWKSLNSVYPSPPITLLRAILLAACEAAATGPLAPIPWLACVDMVPFRRLEREEPVITGMLSAWATATETAACTSDRSVKPSAKIAAQAETEPRKTDQAQLQRAIAAAVGPHDKASQAAPNSNPHWTNAAPNWSHEFTPRMATLLAAELDEQAEHQAKELQGRIAAIAQSVAKLTHAPAVSSLMQLQIQTVSWSHALYSASTRQSYRSLTPAVAAVVMAADVLDLAIATGRPVPASVGYTLAEAVARLGETAGWQRIHPLTTLLQDSSQVPPDCEAACLRMKPVAAGRANLRDLVSACLSGRTPAADLLATAGLPADAGLSLPAWAHALFRQGLAVHLAKQAATASAT